MASREELPPYIGQGKLDVPGMLPEIIPREINWDERISISSLIKYISDVNNLDPSMVSERDMRVMSPDKIAAGLYVPQDKRDKEVHDARNGIIFPPEEFKFIAISPLHVARKAANSVRSIRRDNPDKEEVSKVANRASGHALAGMLERSENLKEKLKDDRSFMKLIVNNLGTARNTGFFAHYNALDLKLKLASAETAIFDSLNVAATTFEWDEDKHERAKRTVEYQLYGRDVKRHRNWVGYAAMAGSYARRRMLVVGQSQGPLKAELAKYQPYLDEAK